MKPKPPPIPVEQHETLRHLIIVLLEQEPVGAKEISGAVGIAEKAVFTHLEHIRRSIHHERRQFIMEPASCRKCGFVFAKRERLLKPGKCPVCRGQSITEPLFSIR